MSEFEPMPWRVLRENGHVPVRLANSLTYYVCEACHVKWPCLVAQTATRLVESANERGETTQTTNGDSDANE